MISENFSLQQQASALGFKIIGHDIVQEAPPFAASCASCVLALQEHLLSKGTPSRALSI